MTLKKKKKPQNPQQLQQQKHMTHVASRVLAWQLGSWMGGVLDGALPNQLVFLISSRSIISLTVGYLQSIKCSAAGAQAKYACGEPGQALSFSRVVSK